MNDHQSILDYLRNEEVQERIRQNIQRSRTEVTVTIGRAARLFGFTENQLRNWDERGLLKPQEATKQRQYSIAELEKLAIIRELMRNGGYSPGEILANSDRIWSFIPRQRELPEQAELQPARIEVTEAQLLPINVRIENARKELFLRYYASYALRLSLTLICDELPGTPAGLILPLEPDAPVADIRRVEDLPKLGPSLVGWLSRGRSSHALFTSEPFFQYSTDYDLFPLTEIRYDQTAEQPKDNTFIVMDRRDRRAKNLFLSSEIVGTIRRLLAPLYENAQDLRSCFDSGMRDELLPAPDLVSTNTPDSILDGLADIIIHLGGCTGNNQDRWRFCCILVPKDTSLPLQQHTLVVRAQSRHSPHKIGGTTLPPDRASSSLSMRAYQSGQVVYHPSTDASLSHHEVEGPVLSALAMPIGGENGPVVAALYVASYQKEAFSKNDQSVLRLLCRMIEEIILTYGIRNRVKTGLTNAIDKPVLVDPLFANFASESDFVRDVEDLLTTLRDQLGPWEGRRVEKPPIEERKESYRNWESTGEVISFIAVDIDNQSSLAAKYGDQVTRNLSREVGLRILRQMRLLGHPENRRLYHLYADRFYLLLKNTRLNEARNKAAQLKGVLDGDYPVEARRTSAERLMLPESKLDLPDVRVRLGIASYPYEKLKEMLQRYYFDAAVAEVRAEVMRGLDEQLNRGQQEGGNVIVSWDVDNWDYKPLSLIT